MRDLLEIGASMALIQELVGLFKEDVPTRLAMLRMALSAADAEHTAAEAHQLKGALSNLGLVRFADLAARIETSARTGHFAEVPRMAEGLGQAYDDSLHALEAAFPGD
jgi:HPt (histidine-containing phosphotransfer) domain-containing protein